MPRESVIFTKHIQKDKVKYYLEYYILEEKNHYGIKVKSTVETNVESKTIFPIKMTKEQTMNFLNIISKNLVFPITLADIYEDYIYDYIEPKKSKNKKVV